MVRRLLTGKNRYSYHMKTHKMQFQVTSGNLALMDKAELENSTLLSDKHIAAAQILQKKYHFRTSIQRVSMHSFCTYHSVDKDIICPSWTKDVP